MTTAEGALPAADAPRHGALRRLYRGETHFDFVGRRKWWYLLSGIVIVAGLVSLGVRGLNLGIEFRGGTSWVVPANGVTVAQATSAVQGAGVNPSLVQGVGLGSNAHIDVQADLSKLPVAQRTAVEDKVAAALAKVTHSSVANAEKNVTEVGPTWGSQITHKAVIAVIVFFAVVVIYISLRFEWKMAVAALAAVLHDLLVVAGVYSLSGLQVTPDTVVAVLTILGYSLYDTVVVFDRVADNTKGIGATGRMTYEDVVNLSMNQTLARSVNTSLVAILPVLSVLVVGAQILGATTLQYFGFALVIGLLSGAYSSIFIASPLLAQLKEREPRYRSIRQKLESRGDRTGLLTPRAAAELAAAGPAAGRGRERSGTGRPGRAGTGRPGRAGTGQRAGTAGGVIRPGSARRTGAAPPAGEVPADELAGAGPDAGAARTGNGSGGNGSGGNGNGSAVAAGAGAGAARRPAGSRPAGGAARRPPQRKKGGSKKGGGGRRR